MSLSPEVAKKKFYESVAYAAKTCTFPTILNYETPLFGHGDITVHSVFKLVVGIGAIINILFALYLTIGHLINWCRPLEQKQQVRVIVFLAVLSITSFLQTAFYDADVYIEPAGQLYEGFAITSIFLLYIQIIMPDLRAYDSYFRQLEAKSIGKKSPRWFRIIWTCVFQILIVRVILLIAQEVFFSYVCPVSETWADGKTGFTAIQGISTATAVIAIVQFERSMKKRFLQGHRTGRKLWSFKIVVILQVIQEQVFVVLALKKIWIPPYPYYTSYNDFLHGIPQVMFIIELLIAAVTFLWAYEWKKYRNEVRQGAPVAGSPMQALMCCCNFADMVYGTLYAVGGPVWMRNKALELDRMPDIAHARSGEENTKSSDEEWRAGSRIVERETGDDQN